MTFSDVAVWYSFHPGDDQVVLTPEPKLVATIVEGQVVYGSVWWK